MDPPYYRSDLARIHHLGFGFHADAVAPGIIALLESVRDDGGLVVELGCGSGLLTRHLLDAGHRVLATDASPAMLQLAHGTVPDAERIQQLVLPEDPIPTGDAIVAVGHPLSYLPTEAAIRDALGRIAAALQPGGIVALDICDLEWGRHRIDAPPNARVEDDWVLITRSSVPSPDRYVREMTTFLRDEDGSWRRDDERHDNVLVDTTELPSLLREHGIEATVGTSFGDEELPTGLRSVVGHRRA